MTPISHERPRFPAPGAGEPASDKEPPLPDSDDAEEVGKGDELWMYTIEGRRQRKRDETKHTYRSRLSPYLTCLSWTSCGLISTESRE